MSNKNELKISENNELAKVNKIQTKENKLVKKNTSSEFDSLNHEILSEEEEKKITRRIFDHGDVNAAKKLVLSNLRFVNYIAKGYEGYGLQYQDLVQEGTIGLIKAVKKFDPNYNVRFISFAVYYIKSEINEYIMNNWSIVKIATTKAQRKLFFNLKKYKTENNWFSKSEITQVAKDLNVSYEDVKKMETRLLRTNISFDGDIIDADDDSLKKSPDKYLVDEQSNFVDKIEEDEVENILSNKLKLAIGELDDRSQYIIKSRWLEEPKKSLQELSVIYNISAERVRQIESNAMKKIKASIGGLPLLENKEE